jgi:hypothetical protein
LKERTRDVLDNEKDRGKAVDVKTLAEGFIVNTIDCTQTHLISIRTKSFCNGIKVRFKSQTKLAV